MIVLDTNVVSEQTRPRPSTAVTAWAATQDEADIYTTAITEAEMLLGVEAMPAGRKRDLLEDQVKRIFKEDFVRHVLPFDSDAAQEFAHIVVERERLGKPIKEADAQIAAIARSRGAAIATRNVSDFEHCGITVINPWTEG